MTIQEKINRFLEGNVGIRVETEEIAEELARVFTKLNLRANSGCSSEELMKIAWDDCGSDEDLYVSYRATDLWRTYKGLAYGTIGYSGKFLDDILEVTLEELKEF